VSPTVTPESAARHTSTLLSLNADPSGEQNGIATSQQPRRPSERRSRSRSGVSRSQDGRTGQEQKQEHTKSPPTPSSSSRRHRHRVPSDQETPRPSATVSPAPTPAMHWTRAKVHGQSPPKELRAQTVNLVDGSVFVFGGSDAKNCVNTLYVFDAGLFGFFQWIFHRKQRPNFC
jgi:hypothetical protein